MTKITCVLLIVLCSCRYATAQTPARPFTHADTLRGTNSANRGWWNILRYDITVRPDYLSKTITGNNKIEYTVAGNNKDKLMQIDLQAPLIIDSILLDDKSKMTYRREGNAWQVNVPPQQKASKHTVNIFYGGKVHEAVKAPWDGGWIWAKDSLDRPWMTVACQGIGASIWYPCKDYQGDEPDSGASLTMIVPDTLVAIANGRIQSQKNNGDGTTTFKWAVINPISNYCIIPYIGKYQHFAEEYTGEKGKLDLTFWALDYHLEKARSYMPPEVHHMLGAFEHWFGPYPFYEDGYQLIETSHTGMEHQSAVSYGNWFRPGYRDRDLSGTGWGMKWDFIIIHESGHEWFGNNITTKDLADMWVHEGFTNYSETLFVDYLFGPQAGNEYNAGSRKGIKNDRPIIAHYQVNEKGSDDMYPKAGNMLHAIRHGLDDDELFRQLLRGLNKTFYHQTVTSRQTENYVSAFAKFDYSKVFDQYLRTIQIPVLELKIDSNSNRISYRYTHCVNGFNLPLTLKSDSAKIRIVPGTNWQSRHITAQQLPLFNQQAIEGMYYVRVQ